MRTRRDLTPYQNDIVGFIRSHRFAAIWALMGAGKTAATLTALSDLMQNLYVVNSLVIAPLRVANTVWAQEAQQWEHLRHLSFAIATGSEADRRIAVNSGADVVVINRENVEWLVDYFGVNRWPFDNVVIDEASSFRNHESKRWKALREVRKHISTIYELTGTPAPKGYVNLWAQMFLLDRGYRLGKAFRAYQSRYFVKDHSGYGLMIPPGREEEVMQEIRDKVKDIVLVVENYAGLPDLTKRRVVVEMPPKIKRKYQDFQRELVLQLEDTNIDAANAGVLSNKLRQFANGAVYETITDENGKRRSGRWFHMHDLKIDALKEIRDEFQGRPLLVAYEFKTDLERLQKAFPDAVVLDKKGACIPDWNAGKIPMLLAHPASAGHGLNLQESTNIVVFFGLTWDLELYDQFLARLRRKGQKEDRVIALHIITKGTEDERVMKVLEKRSRTQRDLVEAVRRLVEAYREAQTA